MMSANPMPAGPLRNSSGDSCEIMGPAGTLVQILMGLFAFLILTCKRAFESPKREWSVWALDTSKQGISGGVTHVLNVLSALLMTAHEADSSNADSCAWYLITMLFDTTIGCLCNLVILVSLEKLFTRNKLEYLKSGNYFSEKKVQQDTLEADKRDGTQTVYIQHVYIDIDYLAWTLQLVIWCAIVAIVKTGLFMIQTQLTVPLGNFGTTILGVLNVHGLMRLIFVLVIVPTISNSIQFWITDNFLKKKVFTESDLGAKSVYFKAETKERKGLGRASTVIRATMGQSVVIQIPTDKTEKKRDSVQLVPSRIFKVPQDHTETPRVNVDRRTKSF